jgi:hypothetical protein
MKAQFPVVLSDSFHMEICTCRCSKAGKDVRSCDQATFGPCAAGFRVESYSIGLSYMIFSRRRGPRGRYMKRNYDCGRSDN